MKAFKRVLLILFVAVISVAFSGGADDVCSQRKNVREGFTYKTEKFKADGTTKGYAVVVIDSVQTQGDSLLSFFTSKGLTAEGRPATIVGHFICSGNNFILDPMSLADNLEKNDHFRLDQSTPMIYPYHFKIGDTLLPWKLHFTIKEEWGGEMNFKMDCPRRECTGRDTLTIGDQRFDTWLVDSYSVTTVKQGLVTMGQMNQRITEWISPTHGILRTEIYANGKLTQYSKVTEITEAK